MFKLHVLALLMGTILDFFIGRLYSIWNPFDSIKEWIKYLDRALLGDEIILLEPSKQKNLGMWAVVLTVLPVAVLVAFFNILCYEIAPVIGVIFEAIATYFCLEGRRIYLMGRNVSDSFYADGISSMAHAYHLLTEKDSWKDTEEDLTKSTITYISNEACDSVIGPLVAAFLFGPVGGFVYRTVDLLDSLVGNHDSRYEYFGYYSAKLSQLFNKICGVISADVAVFSAKYTFGEFNGKNASYINLRDKMKSVSAFAGAIGIELKDGKTGDEDKRAVASDIKTAIALLRNMFFVCQCFLLILLVFF